MKQIIIIAIFLLSPLLNSKADAFLWFGDGDDVKVNSGVDLKQGYDVNTVVTIIGKVSSLPHSDEKKNMLLDIVSGSETYHVSIGSEAAWEKNPLAISINDELTVKGSKAQGSNGEMYLLAQRMTTAATSGNSAATSFVIRDEQGNINMTKNGANQSGKMPLQNQRLQGQGGNQMRGGMRGGGMQRPR